MLWYPDFCPSGGCEVEVDKATGAFVRINSTCAHHQGVKDTHSLTDEQLNQSILQSSFRKEQARVAIRTTLGFWPEFRVNPDGSITLLIPNVAQRNQARALALARLAQLGTPPIGGVSAVDVET